MQTAFKKMGFILSGTTWGVLFSFWIYGHSLQVWGLTGWQQISESLLILQAVLFFVFAVFRKAAKTTSWSLMDIITSFLGSFSILLFIRTTAAGTSLIATVVQIIGSLLTIAAIISLNRSFGMLPANRAIQRGGMYRWVRHPLYASYQIFSIGYIINQPSLYNGLVAVLCLLSQILRIFAEEKMLLQDPEYQAYVKQVRWRLLPFLF
ncbi:MAG TPA: methyltransferase [Candidatus Omnitrophota bacterium]|nr:methyltransferase [Candidatus Omnitrophota bacterium]